MATIIQEKVTAIDEWRSGWPLVLTCFLGTFLSVTYTYSLGIFIEPIQTEFEWQRAQVASALTITSIVGAVAAPLVGKGVDKFGARRIGLFGVSVFTISLASVSLTQPSIVTWIAIWIAVGLGFTLIKPMVWTSALAGHFVRSRGLAFAVMLCGAGVAGAIIPPATQLAIDLVGWRMAYVVLGAAGALLVLPLMLVFFYDRRVVTGDTAGSDTGQSKVRTPARHAIFSSQFLRLCAVALVFTAAIYSFVVHFALMMKVGGLTATMAASVASGIGIASIAGRLLSGTLLDRCDPRYVGGIAFTLPIIACLLLLSFPTSITIAIGASMILGLSLGAETETLAYVTLKYFGEDNYGFLFGILLSFIAIGTGVGPLLAALIYDYTGGYRIAFMAAMPAFAGAGLLIFTLRDWRETQR